MTENHAICYVLDGGHPGNCIKGCRTFANRAGDSNFADFIKHDIPEGWFKFRYLCHLLYVRKEEQYGSC